MMSCRRATSCCMRPKCMQKPTSVERSTPPRSTFFPIRVRPYQLYLGSASENGDGQSMSKCRVYQIALLLKGDRQNASSYWHLEK